MERVAYIYMKIRSFQRTRDRCTGEVGYTLSRLGSEKSAVNLDAAAERNDQRFIIGAEKASDVCRRRRGYPLDHTNHKTESTPTGVYAFRDGAFGEKLNHAPRTPAPALHPISY